MWYQVISELFVNLAAGWFGVVFIEPQLGAIHTRIDVFWLILKLIAGIISLYLAKYFRERARKRK